MEQNLPVIAKKFWSIVRVLFFMLRKGISKAKFLADLTITLKRGKIAGKAALHNLMFHHAAAVAVRRSHDYEFSCSNSPAFHFPTFHLNKKKHAAAALPIDGEILAAASPALPGFGPSPMVRQLRITDSPFPLSNVDDEDSNHVDEAAEKFIIKFYNDLKRQNSTPTWSFS